ncbi:hypothetical protein GOBAR_DD09936 [Gossypium barbadense]|nr:hypothetical protein GOBAR_DD09936 [Gossypium barbadense]
MGLVGVQESGDGEMALPLGNKNNTRNYVIASAIFASLNNVILGYDVGVMSGEIIFIREGLRITEVQEVLVGIFSIISLLGSLAGGRTSDTAFILIAQASALGAVGNRVSSGLVAMSFLSLSHTITVAGTFFLFLPLSALSVLFVYKLGKSLEQIKLLFQRHNEWQGSEVEMEDTEHLVEKP